MAWSRYTPPPPKKKSAAKVTLAQVMRNSIARQNALAGQRITLPGWARPPSTAGLEEAKANASDFQQYLMDPGAYATSSANAAYDAAIATLQREQGHVMPQSAQNQKDLTSWFGQTQATQAKGAEANKAALAQQMAGLQDAGKAMVSALGGGANPGSAGVAQSSLESLGGTSAQGMANAAYDNKMPGIIGLQENQEHVNEKNRAANALADLTFQIANQQNEKGQYYGTKLSEGNQIRFGQQSDLANMTFGQAKDIFGAKFDTARYNSDNAQRAFEDALNRKNSDFSNYTSLINNSLATQMAPGQLAQQAATLAGTKADTKLTGTQTAKINQDLADANGGNKIDLSDPTQAGKVEQSLRNAFTGNGGQFKMDPATAETIARNQLARYGVTGPDADAFISSIMKDVLDTSHAAGKWTQYQIGQDGRIHKTHAPTINNQPPTGAGNPLDNPWG